MKEINLEQFSTDYRQKGTFCLKGTQDFDGYLNIMPLKLGINEEHKNRMPVTAL